MKFGAHSYIFIDTWTDDCLHLLNTARELGLDCLEIGIGDDVHFTPALTRRRAETVGLELTISPGGLWPMACNLASAEAADRAAGLVWHQKQIDLASELGATAYCGSLYGHTGIVHRHPPQPDEYRHMADGLAQLAGYGHARGVAIVLEPMSHFRTHLINKPEQAMPLLALADHPNLALLLDTYHMVTEVRDYGAAIRTAGNKLWGVHACENDRGVPGGGLVPWAAVFAALGDIGFDGYVMMESYNSSLGDFAWQRAMFHNVCPDARAFIGQGLRFLKQGLLRSCEA